MGQLTKAELRKHLKAGKTLADLLVLSPGQGNEIFKADKFSLGDDIIYIPDLSVYDLSFYGQATTAEDIQNILDHCYTGKDFVAVAEGDQALAYRLFCYVDWQGPSSALLEVEYESDEDSVQANVAYKQHLDHLAATGIDISEYRLSVRLD